MKFDEFIAGYGDQSHPERLSDEVFIGNSTTENAKSCGFNWRMGSIAYKVDGNPILPMTGLYPLFVKKDELREYFDNLPTVLVENLIYVEGFD